MTSIKGGRILVVVMLLSAYFLLVTCTSKFPKPAGTPKPPAAERRADGSSDSTTNDPQHYDHLLTKIEADRVALAKPYEQASSAAERAPIVVQARGVVISSI
jgi:hypothetical protein